MVKTSSHWQGLFLVVTFFVALWAVLFGPAMAHSDIHRDVVQVRGYALCNEDERLVPIRHHGYVPERPSGWVYTCKPFDNKGKFAP